MKHFISQIRPLGTGIVGFIFALTLVTVGALSWINVHAGVADTPHNLGSTGTGPNHTDGTGDICVFCHTPHGGATGASVPLWNRTLTPGTYTTYSTLGTSTLDGEEAPVGSVSIACLSCHDGTQAMDTLLNDPGSGVINTAFQAGVWTGTDTLDTGIASIGQDLTNDHPIGIQYGGGGLTTTTPNGALNDPDFNAAENGDLNGTTVWWVDTELTPNQNRDKSDMLLYTRTEATVTGGAQPFVECASCHDPHVDNLAGNNPTFLRVTNVGSRVCLACHDK